ncbi:carboxypeptidase-like regulatory domain-containing protein [Salinimicrobium xinjiangense]|uniref:carboxypeptidase-like regulatory domain-containing protein n=1 Tax=Salinimicrobium xinjiangense TaxID=438596 RepID=UPI0012EBE36C|nr:carboxypeptidase-like regulatory domain-containing protein [Salinimicrobium xinjiangense]
MRTVLFYLLMLFGFNLIAQTASLKGKITAGGKGVPGASIYCQAYGIGTSTDDKGNYILNKLPAGKIDLTISALGYQTITKKIAVFAGENNSLNLKLQEITNELEEVILVDHHTGITRQSPYNISSISLKGIEKKGSPLGVMGTLKEVPGVYGAEFGHGIVKPFIRGLGFSRIVTIYQGNKLENHQWGADHGLGINDLGIKRA